MSNDSFSKYENMIDNNHKTLSVRVYDMILNLIIEGELKLNERINSDVIAKAFGVSRTPVREALKSLEKTGLVHFKSYAGAYVRKLTVHEIEEIYSIRMQLETFALEKVFENVTQEDIDKLSSIQNDIEQKLVENPINVKEIYFLNEKFHMELYKISQMPKLCEIIENLWTNLSLYRFILASNENYSDEIKKEHEEYIKCLVNKEKNKIVSITRKNLTNHLKRVPKLVNDYYMSLN
ncbi:MAG: GntR family transcriptional regulator [Eubacteriales bacterium]